MLLTVLLQNTLSNGHSVWVCLSTKTCPRGWTTGDGSARDCACTDKWSNKVIHEGGNRNVSPVQHCAGGRYNSSKCQILPDNLYQWYFHTLILKPPRVFNMLYIHVWSIFIYVMQFGMPLLGIDSTSVRNVQFCCVSNCLIHWHQTWFNGLRTPSWGYAKKYAIWLLGVAAINK